jgi:nucleotide-binding universal stress UspA family protein
MNQTILLAVDAARGGSADHVAAAANEVRQLSRDTGDRVLVLHVHEVAYGRFGRLQVDCGDGEGEKMVDGIVSDLREAGVTADGEIRTTDVGRIARTILAAAEECDARIVVLGSSSRTDLPYFPFGSVSHRLLHLARRPVLIVPWQKDLSEKQDLSEKRAELKVPPSTAFRPRRCWR